VADGAAERLQRLRRHAIMPFAVREAVEGRRHEQLAIRVPAFSKIVDVSRCACLHFLLLIWPGGHGWHERVRHCGIHASAQVLRGGRLAAAS